MKQLLHLEINTLSGTTIKELSLQRKYIFQSSPLRYYLGSETLGIEMLCFMYKCVIVIFENKSFYRYTCVQRINCSNRFEQHFGV